jgi:hypothetical protein
MKISIDDPARDDNIIIQTFMKELRRRDDEANRNMDVKGSSNHNEFNVHEIDEAVLGAYSLEKVIDTMQRFEMDSGDPFLEFGGQNRNELVHLTNSGRAHCGEFGL